MALDARQALWNGLLKPARDGGLDNVRLILGVQSNDLGSWLSAALPSPRTIVVDTIGMEDFPPLALEYLTHRGLAVSLAGTRVAAGLVPPPRWSPRRLPGLFRLMQGE